MKQSHNDLLKEGIDLVGRYADTKNWTPERERRLQEIKVALGVKKLRQAKGFNAAFNEWSASKKSTV